MSVSVYIQLMKHNNSRTAPQGSTAKVDHTSTLSLGLEKIMKKGKTNEHLYIKG